jgi:hypothetical protein
MSFQADSPTFTGTVTVPNPTEDTDAASKEYVDTAVKLVRRGSVTLTNESAKPVVLNPAFADTNYRISLTPTAPVATWYTDKAVGGFTVHTSANINGSVDWIAAHD